MTNQLKPKPGPWQNIDTTKIKTVDDIVAVLSAINLLDIKINDTSKHYESIKHLLGDK